MASEDGAPLMALDTEMKLRRVVEDLLAVLDDLYAQGKLSLVDGMRDDVVGPLIALLAEAARVRGEDVSMS